MTNAVQQAAPWIERLARIGYLAIGIVYITAGSLTALAALRQRGQTSDRSDALSFILDKPFGRAMLVVIAIGLAGYAFWRITSGIVDSDHRGNDAKGLAIRASAIGTGFLYSFLLVETVRLITRTGGGGGDEAAHWTRRMMALPFGRWIAGAVGVGIVVAGIYQLTRAWRAKLSKRLRLATLSTRTREIVVAISRFGIAARGIVFVIIGMSLVTAARRYDAEASRGLAEAFASITSQPYGQMLLAVVAIGFAAYGVYAIVNGLYRQIDAT